MESQQQEERELSAGDPDVQALRGRDAAFVIRVVVWVVFGATIALFIADYLTTDGIGAAAAGGFGAITGEP